MFASFLSSLIGSRTHKLTGKTKPAQRTYRWKKSKSNRNIQQNTGVTGINVFMKDTAQETQTAIAYFKLFLVME